MADSSLIGSAAIDINKIKAKLGEINQQNITLSINSQDILGKIGNVKSGLEALTNKPYDITLNIAGSAQAQIQNLQAQLDNINKQSTKQAKNQQRTNRKSGGSSKKLEQSAGFPVSRRKWAQKYRDAANAEEQKVIQSLLGKDATLISASGRQRFDKTGKEIGSDWIVTYRNELGKTVKTMLQSTRALDENGKRADKWRVTGTAINANYEAQAKYVKDITKEYEKMEESAFSKGGLDKNSPFGVAATDALKDYKSELDKIISTKDYSDDSRKKLEQLKSQTQETINQQKELRDAQKASEQSYLSGLKKNSKQLEFEQKTSANAQNLIANAQNELKLLEKSTFSGSKALTGDYAEKARAEITKVSEEFDKLKEAAGKSFSDAMNVSKDGLTASLKNLGAELDKLKGLQYPADKLAAKDVDTLKLDYGNKIQEFRDQLKEAGLESSEFTTKLDALGKSLQTVGAADGSGTIWADWKAQFESLQASYEKFQASASGKGLKLAESIGSNQLEQIQSLANTLNNLPSDLSGAGVENLKQELSTIATEYNNLISQLQSGNLTSDQFAEMSNKAKELDDRLKQASNSAKMFQDGFKNEQSLHKFQNNIDGLRNNFEKLERTYASIIEKNPEIAAKFEQLRNMFEQGQVDPINYAQVASDVSNLGRACSNAAGEASGLRGALQGAFGGVGQYLARFTSAFYIINKSIQTIKSMVNEVTELDTSLMELQKVTTLSGDSLAQFTDNAYKTGKEVGRTGKDVIDAVTTFSRAGYNLEESNELAKAALTMTNVGVDIPNTEAAASDMISILRAYDKQANESMQIIDELYNVANKEPLDFGNITDMLVTSGGTLAQTNTSLEESMGLLTGAFATLRDNSVANGLIQISQRLRGVKEDGEAIEEAGFMPKLKKAFGDAGVEIEDQNKELRSTYDILNDLAGRWDNLSSKQKQYLGEKAAGTRQVKVLNAIMANWDVVEDTIEKANEATGAATEGNEKYLDSIRGRITQFKSAFQDLSRTTVNSDLVKNIVGIGTALVNATTSVGGLTPVVIALTGLFTAFKTSKIQKGFDSLKEAFSSKGIGGSIGKIGLLVTGLTVAVTAISALEKRVDQFNILESSKNKYQTSLSNLEATESQLDGVRTKISSIKSLGTLSFIDQQELTRLEQTEAKLEAQYEVQKKLAEVQKEVAQADFEKLFTNYDSYTTGYAGFDFLNELKQLFGSGFSEGSPFAFIGEGLSEFGVKVEDWGKSNKEIFVKAVDDFKKAQAEITNRNIETFNALQDNQMQMFSGAAPIIDANKEANLAARNEAFDNLSKALEIYNKYQAASQGIERNDMTEPYFQMLDQMGESINSAMQYMHDLDDALRTPFEEILKSDTFSSVSNALIELAQKGELTKDTLSEVDGVNTFIDTIGTLGITAQDAARYINELYSVEQTEETGGVSNKFASIEELITNNYLASESYKTLSAAMTEQQKSGNISMDTYQKLIESDKQLANVLTLTANGYALNSDAVNEYVQAKADEQKIQAMLSYDEQQQKLKELKKRYEDLNNGLIEVDDLQTEIANNESAQNATEQNIEALEAYIREINSATSALSRFKAAQSSANEDANFQDSKKVYDVIKEGNKTGKRNTDDFKTAIDYVLGDNWRDNLDQFGGSVEKAYEHAEKMSKRYSGQKDEKTAVDNFMKDVGKTGLGTYDSKTGSLELNEGVTLGELSEKMKVSKEYLTDMFKLLNTYAGEGEGFFFPEFFTDDDKKEVEARKKALEENEEAQEQLGDKITDVNKQIEEANKNGDEKEAQRLEQQKKRLEDSQKTLEQQHTDIESGVTTDVDTMSIDDAKKKIDELYQVITTLNGAGIDIPVTVGEEFSTLLNAFPQLRGELQNPLPPVNVKMTGDALPKLVLVDGKVKQLEGDHFVDVNVDDNGTADDVKTKVEDVENGTYAAKVDAELGNDTVTGDIESIANSTYPSAKVAAESDAASINTTKAELDDLSKDRTVTYKVKYTKEAEEGEKEFGEWFENELPVADQNLTNIEEPETTQEKTWGQMWKEAWDAGAPAEETVEVPVEVEPKIENDGGFDWIDDWNEKVAQDDTTTIDVQTEASNPEEPIQQVQDAASGAPVELQFDFGDLTQLSTAMQSLIGSAEGAGVDNTSEGAGAISDLRQAYVELSSAMEKAKGVEIGDASGAEQAASEIQSAANNFMAAYNTLSTMTSSITVDPIEVDADTSAALKKVQAIADKGVTVKVSGNTTSLASAIDAYNNRTITVNIQTNEIGGNAKGTKNAAPGPSLVDEEGAELIEHVSRGTYELGTNNGPRMTNLEKGDIVHTASETKRILSRVSKIGGFFRDGLNQVKSVLTGGAFRYAQDSGIGGKVTNTKKKTSSGKKKSSSKKSSSKKSSSSTSMKKLQEWFEKLFDWAEVRLERLQTITDEWIYKAGQAIGYAAQNAQLTNAMKSVENQIRDTTAAYDLYIKQADTVAKKTKLSADIINRIQNGTIEISSYDKDTQEKIRMYTEWWNFSCHFE